METNSLQSILEKIEDAKSNGLNKVEVELKYNPDVEDNPITSELVKMSYRTQHSSNNILTVFWGRTITADDVEKLIAHAKNSGENEITLNNMPEDHGEVMQLMAEIPYSSNHNGLQNTLTIYFNN